MKSQIVFFISFMLCILSAGAQDTQTGIASYYSDDLHGNKTAYGEKYDKTDFTCASLTFKHNDILEVTRIDNGNKVIVRVNDKGPFKAARVIDLSRAAAAKIGLLRDGLTRVHIKRMTPGDDIQPKTAAVKEALPKDEKVIDGTDVSASYMVQMGVFTTVQNADIFAQQLRDKKLSAIRIISRQVKDKLLYSVGAGPFQDKESADAHKERLKKKGFDCFVIPISAE